MDAVGMTEQPAAIEQPPTTEQRISEEVQIEEPVVEMESQQDRPEADGEAAALEEDDGLDTSKQTEEPSEILTTKRKPKPKNQGQSTQVEKVLGTTVLPTARVQKITKADKELNMLTKEAIFLISVATENFVRRFMEEGYTKARLDKRKTVGLKDLAAVTTRNAEFQFLEDVSPASRLDQDEHLLRHLACQGRLDLLTELIPFHFPLTDAKDIIPLPISLASAMDARKRHAQGEDEQPVDLPEVDIMPLNYLQQSTNPLFPGVAMRRPPNTHARHAQPKKRDVGGVEGEEEEHPEGAAPPPTKKASKAQAQATRVSRRSLAAEEAKTQDEVDTTVDRMEED